MNIENVCVCMYNRRVQTNTSAPLCGPFGGGGLATSVAPRSRWWGRRCLFRSNHEPSTWRREGNGIYTWRWPWVAATEKTEVSNEAGNRGNQAGVHHDVRNGQRLRPPHLVPVLEMDWTVGRSWWLQIQAKLSAALRAEKDVTPSTEAVTRAVVTGSCG